MTVRLPPSSPSYGTGTMRTHRHRPSLPPSFSHASASTSRSVDVEDEHIGEWRGRRIRQDVGSWPCDHVELERQEAQEHWLLRILLGFPYIGPVEEVLSGPNARVLDVATGTGIWAIEMADMFPRVEVLGVDAVATQQNYVPQNCEFELVDLDDLPYEPETFDLIHIRFAHSRVHSFPRLMDKCFRLLRPGALLLLFDYDLLPILADESTPLAAQAWHDAFSRSMQRGGMSLFSLEKVLPSLAGRQVEGKDMRVPIGHGTGRMGQLGKIHYINTKAFFESARHVMVVHGGYTDAEVDVLSQAYLDEIEKGELYTRYHALSIIKS